MQSQVLESKMRGPPNWKRASKESSQSFCAAFENKLFIHHVVLVFFNQEPSSGVVFADGAAGS